MLVHSRVSQTVVCPPGGAERAIAVFITGHKVAVTYYLSATTVKKSKKKKKIDPHMQIRQRGRIREFNARFKKNNNNLILQKDYKDSINGWIRKKKVRIKLKLFKFR